MKSTLAPRTRQPIAAIRLGSSERSDNDTHHGTWLVWYMRVLSLAWMGQGLCLWALVLMSNDQGPGGLDAMPGLGAGAVVGFAVLDLVAAVGLWLAAAWGGVVWLVAVAAQWLTVVLLPAFFPFDLPIAAVDVLLVAGYFALTLKAAREIDR